MPTRWKSRCVVLAVAGLASWLGGFGLLNEARCTEPPLAPQAAQPGPVLAVDAISADQARVIANKHFGRQPEAGCFTEERGHCWFVAPPYLDKMATERTGVYVVKQTGKLCPFFPIDDQFLGVEVKDPAAGGGPPLISQAQAKAIWYKEYGRRPCEFLDRRESWVPKLGLHVEARTPYWFVAPRTKAMNAKAYEHYGLHIDQHTGAVSENVQRAMGRSGGKKGKSKK